MRRQNEEDPSASGRDGDSSSGGVRSTTELMSTDAGRLVYLAVGGPRFGGFYLLGEINHKFTS